jgi:proteasome lid subunit RPN8/RPN11
MSAATGLKVPQEMADAILAQARAEYPNEACGVILGRNGIAERLKPMFNAAASPTFYEFDPKDLLALYREVDDNDEDMGPLALSNHS